MNLFSGHFARFAILVLAIFGPVAGAEALPSDAVSLHLQHLFDDGLQKNAYSVLAPDGWKFQGAISWMPKLPTPYVDLSVSNPTLHAAWREFPRLAYVAGVRENWIAAFPAQREDAEKRLAEGQMSPSGFEIREIPASPREYVQNILAPKLCREVSDAADVKIVSETSMPEYAKAQADRDPGHREFQSSRFRLAYTAADGPVEREFVATLIVQRYPDHRGIGASAMWIGEITTCRAPSGKLDALMPTFASIGSSVRVELPWYNQEIQIAQIFIQNQQRQESQMLQDQRDAINQRMDILREEARQASEQVSSQIRQNFAAQQQAKSDDQRRFMNYVNNTANFRDPNDGSMLTLHSDYKYQYIDNHDDVIQTNDPTFSPPVDPSTSWQQMETVN